MAWQTISRLRANSAQVMYHLGYYREAIYWQEQSAYAHAMMWRYLHAGQQGFELWLAHATLSPIKRETINNV